MGSYKLGAASWAGFGIAGVLTPKLKTLNRVPSGV